jgi:hypothetical protein
MWKNIGDGIKCETVPVRSFMDCEWTGKISLLVDGELTLEEAAKVSTHLVACESCQRAQTDFLQLRELVQDYPAPGLFAQRRVLASILASESVLENVPLWKRRIAVPTPILALLFGAVVMLSALTVTWRFWSSSKTSAPLRGRPPAPTTDIAERSLNFSAFDHGERAVIYVVKQPLTSGRRETP